MEPICFSSFMSYYSDLLFRFIASLPMIESNKVMIIYTETLIKVEVFRQLVQRFYDALDLYEVTNSIIVSSPSTKNSENSKCELRRVWKITIKLNITL